jgi:hypothetical protein
MRMLLEGGGYEESCKKRENTTIMGNVPTGRD